MPSNASRPIAVYAPRAVRVALVTEGDAGREIELQRDGDVWRGTVAVGTRYSLWADGRADEGFDPRRSLLDPLAAEVWFPPTHARDAARPGDESNRGRAPLAVAAPIRQDVWPSRLTGRPLVVYEAHVRGLTKRRDRHDAGTFAAAVDELARLADLGVSVIELLPVHQFDPDEGNYWGYMPLVFGAVHRQYSAGARADGELAGLIAGAHDRDIEVWLDVVVNHTTEEDEAGPTYNLRGLADDDYYVKGDDGSYVNDTGTGNMIDATSAPAQALVMTMLDRFADLGVDGFRFDLTAVLSRDPDFVRAIGDWAERRRVRLVAEPWDLARYQVGRAFPDPRWMQWNDRFRDDMRGFLRAEPGLVAAVVQRVQGSPDLFDSPTSSINFLTAHDGFTMYDLVAYDHKHNDANGWAGRDGSDDNRSWNCGWEGDDGVPAEVLAVRRRQMRNAMCLLLLSRGVPMFVAGDEFARTQHGNNNPYNQDNETSWIDWERRESHVELELFVGRLIKFRAEHEILHDAEWWGDRVTWFGATGHLDTSAESRSLAWHLPGLYVMANMSWETQVFDVQAGGAWSVVIDTALESGFTDNPYPAAPTITVTPRSVVVLRDSGVSVPRGVSVPHGGTETPDGTETPESD